MGERLGVLLDLLGAKSATEPLGMTLYDFLVVTRPSLTRGETFEARFLTTDGRCLRRFHNSLAGLLGDVSRYRQRYHCLAGVALRRGNDGTAKGVTRTLCLWAELDAKNLSECPDPKAAAFAAIDAFSITVSVVVDTGGGFHLYWLLKHPIDISTVDARSRLEMVNGALARAVAGTGKTPDHVQDAPRVLRLPGSLNFKYDPPRPVRVVRVREQTRYTLDEVEAALTTQFPWAIKAPVSTISAPSSRTPSAFPPSDLREKASQGRIRRSTLSLLDTTGGEHYPSASEADAAIAAALVGAGLTQDETLALILDSARGRDGLERKGERHGLDYWQRTVQRAAGYVGPVIERPNGLRLRYPGAALPLRLATRPEAPPWPR